MAFVTVAFLQALNLLNVRHGTRSLFSREIMENRTAFVATAAVVVVLALIVEMDALRGFFALTDMTSGQGLSCAAVGSSILIVGELVKATIRARARRRAAGS